MQNDKIFSLESFNSMKELSEWFAKDGLKLDVVNMLIGGQKRIKLTGGMSKCGVALKFAEYGPINVEANGDGHPVLKDYIRIRQVSTG